MKVRMPAPAAPLPARAWAASSSELKGEAVITGTEWIPVRGPELIIAISSGKLEILQGRISTLGIIHGPTRRVGGAGGGDRQRQPGGGGAAAASLAAGGDAGPCGARAARRRAPRRANHPAFVGDRGGARDRRARTRGARR